MRSLQLASVLVVIFAVNSVFAGIRFLKNADEQGTNFEADIMLRPDLTMFGTLRWDNGVIPYVFASGQHNATEQAIIQSAMNEISRVTCIKFVPRTTELDYLNVLNEATGCWSYVGRIRGAQSLNLHNEGGCVTRGITMHELMHAIGFLHSHSDLNRDQFIKVMYENLEDNALSNFVAHTNNYVMDYGHGYDYGSILHYGGMSFTKNGEPTLVPLVPYDGPIGQRSQLSEKDILKVNTMYFCPDYKPKFMFGKTP